MRFPWLDRSEDSHHDRAQEYEQQNVQQSLDEDARNAERKKGMEPSRNYRIKKFLSSRIKRDDLEAASHDHGTGSDPRTKQPNATTSTSTEREVKTEPNYPRPLELYDEATNARLKFGKFLGVLNLVSKWMFWEVPNDSEIEPKVKESRDKWAKELTEEVEIWIVGKDKQHAHLTAVIVDKDQAAKYSSLKVMSREEYVAEQSKDKGHLGLGFLVLDSVPSFLEKRQTMAGEIASKWVFLAAGKTSRLPPYRVLYPSISGNGWEQASIGGVFNIKDQKYGVLARPRGFDVSTEHLQSESGIQPRDERTVTLQDLKGKGTPTAEGISQEPPSSQTGFSRQASSRIPASEFSPVDRLGCLLPRLVHILETSWALVQLDDETLINMMNVPGGFGDRFVLTKHGDPTPESKVWILTGTSGMLMGIARPRNMPVFWEVQMTVKLTVEDRGSWVIDAASRSLVGIIADESAMFCPIMEVVKEFSTSYDWWPKNSEKLLPVPQHKKDKSTENNQTKNPEQKRRPIKVGKLDGLEVWELDGDMKAEWKSLEPRLQDLIRRTPPKSRSMPTIMLEGLLIGPHEPTVLISSSSKAYASQLKKSIQRHGLLSNTGFRVKTQDSPIIYK